MTNAEIAQEIVDEIGNDLGTTTSRIGLAWQATDAFSRDEIKLAWKAMVITILEESQND